MVGGRCTALKALLGVDVYERALATLDAEARIGIEQCTALSWVPVADTERLVLACAEAANRDPHEVNVASARRATEASFRTVWRLLLRIATDDMLLSRTARAYDRAYDRGKIEVHLNAGSGGSCELTGRPEMSQIGRDAFGVGIQTVLELGGRGGVTVHGRPTADGAIYTVHR
ncbi:MAG: hypothetical protein CMN30_12925 [Sandaracinus sp.]|nr:hypothetical protein [Sandaracinus sp.]